MQAEPRYRGFRTDPAPATAVAPTGRAHPGPSGHPFCGGTHSAESVEPAAAGAASPRYETGWFKLNAHPVYPGLSVAVGIRSERGEDGLLPSGDGGEKKGCRFPYFCCVANAVVPLEWTYPTRRLCRHGRSAIETFYLLFEKPR